MGRPTLLTEDLVAKADTYLLDGCIGELPTKEGLAIFLNVNRDSLYEWNKGDTDLHKRFSDIFDEIMAEQGRRLINGGLYGRFNSTITKLMLSKHDYIERSDVVSDGQKLEGVVIYRPEKLPDD